MMDNTGYIALSQQIALGRQIDLMANNIANVNTSGYKREVPRFETFLDRTDNQDRKQLYSYVLDQGTYRDFSDGFITQTDSPLDFGLTGEGFFQVQTPNGVRYTRAGHFTLDANGQLVNQRGQAILDDGGAPINLDPTDTTLVIARDGTISNAEGRIARFGVVEFENRNSMIPEGDGLYSTDQQPQPSPTTVVRQGFIEGSNVNSVIELTQLIAAQRAFVTSGKIMQSDDQLERRMIDRLGKFA